MPDRPLHFETLQVHAGQEEPESAYGSRAVPIYASSAFVFQDSAQAAARFALQEGGNIYSRLTNPTVSVFEERVNALEGGVGALGLATGAAAIDVAISNITSAGDHIVAAADLYGGTVNYLSNVLRDRGVEVTFVDPADLGAWEEAVRPNTKLLYGETLGNPNSDVLDIEGVAAIAHDHGVPLVIDDTFSTPYLLRPLEHGADIVVMSATKFICGHGTVMGGVLVDGGTFDWAASDKFPGLSAPNSSYHGVVFTQAGGKAAFVLKARATILRDAGPTLSPFNAWLLLQGLETLSLRMERHVSNALAVVDWLRGRPEVERVNHPCLATGRAKELYDAYFPRGAAPIFTFDVAGDAETAKRFTESLSLFSLLANVGDSKSLVIHPASTTHSQLGPQEMLAAGIRPTTVRLSIGIEHIDDILADLQSGFEAIARP